MVEVSVLYSAAAVDERLKRGEMPKTIFKTLRRDKDEKIPVKS